MSADAAAFRAAFRRSLQHYASQIAAPEPLACGGMAYCAPAYPSLPDANQVRDLLIEGAFEPACERIERHFQARGRRCLRWAFADDRPAAALESELSARGWRRRTLAVFGRAPPFDASPRHDPGASPESNTHCGTGVPPVNDRQNAGSTSRTDPRPGLAAPPADLRILPARAMRKAYRRGFEESIELFPDAALRRQQAEAANQRLDDPEYDVFVAVRGDAPAGRVGLLQTGDIGCVMDLYVHPASRGVGIGAALLRHALRLAHRLRPRVVVASAAGVDEAAADSAHPLSTVAREAAAARRLLARFGFLEAGSLTEWDRGP